MSADSPDTFSFSMTMPGGSSVLLPNQARPASCSTFVKATADRLSQPTVAEAMVGRQFQQQQIQRL
jgi:hypothetical protein